MWAIIGLGNYDSKYSKTRHNLGFMVLEAIARSFDITLHEKEEYRAGRGSIAGQDILLIEPLTFMNNSGIAVKNVLRKFNITSENLIVIHDDIDMDIGKLKIKRNGSAGGHRGVESIIQSIGTKEFVRVKIGIGRDTGISPETYVLKKFRKDELPIVKDAIERASDAVTAIISIGAIKAMNKFN